MVTGRTRLCSGVLLLMLLAPTIALEIQFPDEDSNPTTASTTAAGRTFASTTPIPVNVVTVAHDATDADSHVNAVHEFLTTRSGADATAENPDISDLAMRSILPRQNSECRAPTRESGTCGTVRECPGIYRIRDASYLRRFLCGYSGQTPLVCCPYRWTADYFYNRRTTTTRAPLYNNNGYGNQQNPYQYGQQNPYQYGQQNPYQYGQQNNHNRYYSQTPSPPRYPQYPDYARPSNNFHFSEASQRPARTTTSTTTSAPRTTTRASTSQSQSSTRPRKPSFLPEKCGVGAGLRRIVGGTEASPGDYPWMAAIYYNQQGSWLQACGGSLVSNLHVVTAAHCVVAGSRSQNLPTRLFRIRLGDHDLEAEDDVPRNTSKDFNVAKISRHSQFNSETYKNDIAIMQLDSPVTFNQYIAPLCLPYDGVFGSLDNEYGIVSGWGYTKYEGKGSDVLKQAAIRIWPENECKEAFKKEVTITQEYLCAGDGKQDSCQGDSGGPLFYNEGTRFYLIGVVSFGKKCATPGYPGAYTRVTKYLDWLNDHF